MTNCILGSCKVRIFFVIRIQQPTAIAKAMDEVIEN